MLTAEVPGVQRRTRRHSAGRRWLSPAILLFLGRLALRAPDAAAGDRRGRRSWASRAAR